MPPFFSKIWSGISVRKQTSVFNLLVLEFSLLADGFRRHLEQLKIKGYGYA